MVDFSVFMVPQVKSLQWTL